MKAYVALLRAINVGGTGKLRMAELRELCEGCGLSDVGTYIQSGNVVFRSRFGEARLERLLRQALAEKMGKPVGVLLRTAEQMQAIVKSNPFGQAPPNRVYVLFMARAPGAKSLKDIEVPGREELALRGRELYVHYPDGMGQSKLKLAMQESGTSRNINTVTKLVSLLEALN